MKLICSELHVFDESPQSVLNAVNFLREIVVPDQPIFPELTFVMSRVRVAPMKGLTIPRLELKAAELASRLRTEVHGALTMQIDRNVMCTDGTTVPQWLQSSDEQSVFCEQHLAKLKLLNVTGSSCGYCCLYLMTPMMSVPKMRCLLR